MNIRTAVMADALYCVICGALAGIFAMPLAGLTGLPIWSAYLAACGLIGWGVVLWWLTRRQGARASARVAIIGNIVWLAGAALAMVSGLFPAPAMTLGLIVDMGVLLLLAWQLMARRANPQPAQ